jgi:hypothetical protein
MTDSGERTGARESPGRGQLAGGFLFLLFALGTVWLSLRMPIGTFRSAGPGLFPLCLGLLLAALAVVYTIRTGLAMRPLGKRPGRTRWGGSVQPVLGFMAVIAFAAGFLEHLGYAPTACVAVMALLQLLGARFWRRNLIVALVSGIVAHLVFVKWLQIPFPEGWLGL